MADDLTLYNDAVTEALRRGRTDILRKRVISEPGAAIELTVLELSERAKDALTVSNEAARAFRTIRPIAECEVCGKLEHGATSLLWNEPHADLVLCHDCRAAVRKPSVSGWGRFWRALTLHAFCREEIAEGGGSYCLTCNGYR